MSIKGVIFDIAECSIHDGPGMRVTVFMKGCPLRCRWCHSPEGQSPEIEILHPAGLPERVCGKEWESGKLAEFLRDRAELLDGGVTFSGGEPLMQSRFLLDVLDKLSGIHTLVDSCGFAPEEEFLAVARKVSLFYFGLKLLNDPESLHWTGRESEKVKRNLLLLDRETSTPYRLRIPMLEGVTGRESYLRELEKFCRELKRIEGIDFLPSNKEAGAKYAACGRTFAPGFDTEKVPELPEWFSPGCPAHLLASNHID
ncbi:MAG: radical SAM protein [Lentisphaeria bacterium]|nr:radical SAM protein [Lentisphaeria bacterium]